MPANRNLPVGPPAWPVQPGSPPSNIASSKLMPAHIRKFKFCWVLHGLWFGDKFASLGILA